MKKLIILTMALIFTGMVTTYGQEKEAPMKNQKKAQSDMENDFYISYGLGSIYYFALNNDSQSNTTSGTFLLGYSRSITKVIAVGFQVSYATIVGTEQTYDYQNYNTYNYETTDNLWQGIANVRFRYLNTRTFCMYSGIGMGVTMDYYKEINNSTTTKKQKLLPAGQLTLLGFRVGRAFSFFGEFGIGTNSIINAGMSYKFGD
ncbi:MAG: hypothetical protein NTW16_13230 [Bacteroidetes bacterium]|nr:hypothetical protein [Bacteroidota bacterium]